MQSLVNVMSAGGLEAISAIKEITTEHPVACDLARDAGAIPILAAFINTNEDVHVSEGAAGGARGDAAPADVPTPVLQLGGTRRPLKSAGLAATATIKFDRQGREKGGDGVSAGGESGSGSGSYVGGGGHHSLAELGDQLLPGMSAACSCASGSALAMVRPTIVPVDRKAEAVAALRNIATSNDANREAITAHGVIPQLVKLMTKLKNDDDNASACSSNRGGGSSVGSLDGSGGSAKHSKRKMALALDRKKLAEDNTHLAESAGQMLHTLLLEGKAETKKVIISSIIATVQQPGSTPPEDVPALMTILRSAAEEQISYVEQGTDAAALQAALDFGRWVKMPAIRLGEARNLFKARVDARKKDERARTRRAGLGLKVDAPPPEDERDARVLVQGSPSPAAAKAEEDGGKKSPQRGLKSLKKGMRKGISDAFATDKLIRFATKDARKAEDRRRGYDAQQLRELAAIEVQRMQDLATAAAAEVIARASVRCGEGGSEGGGGGGGEGAGGELAEGREGGDEVDEMLSPSHQTGGGSRLSTSTSPPASPGRRAPPLSAVLLTPQAPIDADRRFQAQNAHQQRLAACETQIMHAAHVRTPFTDEQKPTSRQRAPITPPSCRAAAAASARISTT